MTKHVSISANENPLYLFYLPLTCWAWDKFGWKPIVIFVKEEETSKSRDLFQFVNKSILCSRTIVWINAEDFVKNGYETATIAQLSRLYASVHIANFDYLITGDSDMIPLSDYWVPDLGLPTIWGWNLTEYQHVPICYIGMRKAHWFRTMEIANDYDDAIAPFIEDDLRKLPQAKSENKELRWCCDQDLITERIKKHWKLGELILNQRGVLPNGYPRGRVDRSAWSQEHKQYIDCHAPHDILTSEESRRKLLHLLKFIWPNEDFTWWENYQKEFLELLKSLSL